MSKQLLVLLPLLLSEAFAVPNSYSEATSSTNSCSFQTKAMTDEESESIAYNYVENEGYDSTDYSTSGLTLPVVEYDVIKKTITSYSISYSNSGYSSTPSKEILGPSGYYSFSTYQYNSVMTGIKDNLYQTEYKYRPYSYLSSIGQTYTQYEGNSYNGSCFSVSDNIVISAAHCFYKYKSFTSFPQARFVLDNTGYFTFYANIKKIIIPKAFYDSGNTDGARSQRAYDWCICVLDQNIGDKVGYLSISSGYTMAGCFNYACGYPSLPNDTRNMQLCTSAASEVNAPDQTSGTALFNLYNYVKPGMSGGPVAFYYENTMTFEQYDGVSSIITRTSDKDSHGYSVKVTNALIETLKKAETL